MQKLRFIYSIQSDGGQTPGPLQPQAHRVLKLDPEAGASIMLNNTVHLIRGRDLYVPPADVAHGIMFGLDKNMLCREWDKAVKRKAMTILNEYSRYFAVREETEPEPQQSAAAEPVQKELQAETSAPEQAPAGPTAQEPTQETLEAPAAAQPEGEEKGQLARAYKVPWKEIDWFLPRFIATWFKDKDTQVYARTIFGGDHAENNNSWTIILEDISAGDRPALKALLERYDKLHEVDIESEWPEQEPVWFSAFPLTTAISNEILRAELLSRLPVPFTFDIHMSIPGVDGLILISDGISI